MKTTILVILGFGIFLAPLAVSAEMLIFNTSDNEFTPGVKNQGWWSDTTSNVTITDNYFTGITINGDHRSYFTFDLFSLTTPVIAAALELRRFEYFSSSPIETFGTFDVATDPSILNNKNGINAAIYQDLGSGSNYGEFQISASGQSTDVLIFELNNSAIADINASAGGWFSIGGALLTPGSPLGGGEGFFGNSHKEEGTQRLVLTVVPEPISFLFLSAGGLILLRKRR